MEIREVLEYLSVDELSRLGAFCAPLLDVDDGRRPSRLRVYLEYLSGRRSEAGWISDALQTDRDGALRVAVWAQTAGVALPAELTTALDARWDSLTQEHAERLEAARAALRAVSEETPGAASLARELESALRRQVVPAERPRVSAALESALQVERAGQGLARDVKDIQSFATEELEESRSKLVALCREAFARALDRYVAGSRHPDGAEAMILRIVPDLYLARDHAMLERVVRGEVHIDDAELAQRKRPPVAGAPAMVPRPMLGTVERALSPAGPLIQPRSSVTQELVKRVTPGRTLSSGEELREIMAAAQTGSPFEAAALYLGAGLATSDRRLRAAALGLGLLEHGRALLDQGQHRFASEELRDAIELLVAGGIHVTTAAIDRAAHALVATIAWPRYRAGGGTHERWSAWVDSPRAMFSWLAAEGHLDIPATLWADFQDDAAAAAFFEAVRVECGRDEELLRAAAAALSSAKRLREYPERCCIRLLLLLEPAGPPSELKDTLTVIAQELASIDPTRPGPAASSFMREHVELLRAQLARLAPDRGAPVDEVLELLPGVLERLAGGSEATAPHVVVSSLVTTFFPAERSRDVDLPFLLQNQSGATAANLTLRVAAQGDSRPRFDGGKDAAERFVGDLQPGESRSVTFPIDLPVEFAQSAGEVAFHARLIFGAEVLEERTLSVACRPGTREGATNPYSTGERAVPQHFIGREKEVRSLISALLGDGPNRTPLIVGIRRIGKTSILYRVKEDEEVLRRYLPVYVSAEDRPSSETTAGFLLYLCEQIHLALPPEVRVSLTLRAGDFAIRPYDAFEAFVDSLGRAALRGRRVLLILDEFDKLLALVHETSERQAREGRPLSPQEALQPEVFGALRKALMRSGALRMVFAGLPQILQQTTYEDRLFGLLLPIWVRQFSEKEATLVFDEGGKAGIRFSAAAQDAIRQATGLHPYLLQLVCYNLVARLQSSGRDWVTPEDLDHVVRTEILPYSRYFLDYERLINARDRPLLRALALRQREVAARRSFVSVSEVARELQRQRITFSPEQVHERFRDLESDDRPLVVHARNNAENYRLVIGMLGDRLISAEDE